MSQAEDLLNSGKAYPTSAAEDEHIVINADRSITVPESLRDIAVQYDHNVETVTFDCPRYWDDVDLSAMPIFVNYMREDGYMDSSPAINITVDEADDSMMHFDWLISGNVTQVNGMLAFLVCAKASEMDGTIKHHWNSKMSTDLFVSEGLNCEGSIITQYHDIITHLLLRMDEIEAGLPSAITISDIENGHRVTLTVAEKTSTFDVLNGEKGDPGEKGEKGDPGEKGEKGDPGEKGAEGVVKDLNTGKEYKVFIGTTDEWNAYEGYKTDVHWIPLVGEDEIISVDHAEAATKAEQDANGNVIHDTYATKSTADSKGPKLYLHDLTLEGSVSDSDSSRTIKWYMQIVSKYATKTSLLNYEWSRIISTFHFGTGYLTINTRYAHILNIRCTSIGTYSAYFKITHPVPEAQSETDELATIVTKEYLAEFGEGATSGINVTNDDITELF